MKALHWLKADRLYISQHLTGSKYISDSPLPHQFSRALRSLSPGLITVHRVQTDIERISILLVSTTVIHMALTSRQLLFYNWGGGWTRFVSFTREVHTESFCSFGFRANRSRIKDQWVRLTGLRYSTPVTTQCLLPGDGEGGWQINKRDAFWPV